MAKHGLLSAGLGGRGFLSRAVPEQRTGLSPNPIVEDILAKNRRIAQSLLPREEGGGAEGVAEAQSGLPTNEVDWRDYWKGVGFPGIIGGLVALGRHMVSDVDPVTAARQTRLEGEARESGGPIPSVRGVSTRGTAALEGPEAAQTIAQARAAATRARQAAAANWARREEEAQRAAAGRDAANRAAARERANQGRSLGGSAGDFEGVNFGGDEGTDPDPSGELGGF